jgi:hypothetical protein
LIKKDTKGVKKIKRLQRNSAQKRVTEWVKSSRKIENKKGAHHQHVFYNRGYKNKVL